MNKLRILVADDHEIVRRGLVFLIKSQPNWEVCAEAENGRQAVELASQLKPNIVVLSGGAGCGRPRVFAEIGCCP